MKCSRAGFAQWKTDASGGNDLGWLGRCFGRCARFVAAFSRRRTITVPGDKRFHQPLLPREFGRSRLERRALVWGFPHDCHAVSKGKTFARAEMCSGRTSGNTTSTNLSADHDLVFEDVRGCKDVRM